MEIARSDEERRALRHNIEERETQLAQYEISRKQLEGEIERQRLTVREREAEISVCTKLPRSPFDGRLFA